MAQEVFLRTAAGIISADKFNDRVSPFKPARHAASAVFIREEQYLNAMTSVALGSTVRFEVNKDGDYLDRVWLVVSMAALSKNAGATFARYCDWLGYSLIREIRVVYGPQILQRIHKEELWIWAQRFLNDEEYVHNARMVGGGLDGASRILSAQREQYLKIPLHTLWIDQSEQQALCLQGLGNKVAFEIVRNMPITMSLMVSRTLSLARTWCNRTIQAHSLAQQANPPSSPRANGASTAAWASSTCTSPQASAMLWSLCTDREKGCATSSPTFSARPIR
jgi:hypothetical protein